MKKIVIVMAGLLASCAAHAALDGTVRPLGTSHVVRQGTTALGEFATQDACVADARQRTTNPLTTARQTFQTKTGKGIVISTEASQEACLVAVKAKLAADGVTRTEGGNVNSCVVTTSFSTSFQPPTCVSTFNFTARYTTGTVEPDPEEPEPPQPCNCTCPPLPRQVFLTWTPPTRNTNGTALTDLAGYRIHYGRSMDAQTGVVQVPNAGATQYTIENLDTGIWYLSIRSYTTGGAESASSNTVMKTVQ